MVDKMSDFKKVKSFLKTMSIEFLVFSIKTSKDCIMDEALKAGAVKTISVRRQVDLAFNAEGGLIGTFTDAAKSWIPKPTNSLSFILGEYH